MFRTFRIISVLLVASLAIVGQQIDVKAIGTLSYQQLLLVFLALILGFTNILVEIFDHRHQKKDALKREKQFQELKNQLARPILPFTLHCVLKYTTRQTSIRYAFGNQIDSFQKIINQFKHAGKFIHPDLIDFPWDENQQVNEYIVARLDKDDLKKLHTSENEHKNHLIKLPFSAELSLYKKNKKGYSEIPDLQLISSVSVKQQPFKVADLRLFNENLYLEFFIYDWAIEANTDQLISIYDLRATKIVLKFDVLTWDEDDFVEPPYFTLLQFKCGAKPFSVLQLHQKALKNPKISKNVGLNHIGDASKLLGDTMSMSYEILLPDEDLKKHIAQYNQ